MQPKKMFKYLMITFALIGRIIPHPWNMTPTVCFSLLSARLFNTTHALFITLIGLFVSDALLAWLQHHAVFGTWSLFTYTGMIMITLSARGQDKRAWHVTCLSVFASALFFWTWTNFGCWLTMPIYSKDLAGLLQCFAMGLPFLKNQLIGSVLWYAALVTGYRYSMKYWIEVGAHR